MVNKIYPSGNPLMEIHPYLVCDAFAMQIWTPQLGTLQSWDAVGTSLELPPAASARTPNALVCKPVPAQPSSVSTLRVPDRPRYLSPTLFGHLCPSRPSVPSVCICGRLRPNGWRFPPFQGLA